MVTKSVAKSKKKKPKPPGRNTKGPKIGPTLRQERFVSEYLASSNATLAAKKAGYSAKSAHSQGCILLKDPWVMRELEERKAKINDKLELTKERVLEELMAIGFSNMADYMDVNEDGDPILDFSKLSRRQASCLQEVTVDKYVEGRGKGSVNVKRTKFRLYDKHAALVDLGKHLGLFGGHLGTKANPIHTQNNLDGNLEISHVVSFADMKRKFAGPEKNEPGST